MFSAGSGRFAPGARKGEAELKAKFDEAIRAAAADGTTRALSEKWSKFDLTPSAVPTN